MAKKVSQTKSHYTPVAPHVVTREKNDSKRQAVERQEVNNALQSQQNNENLTKFILKIAGFTALGIVFVFYYVMSILMTLAPSAPASIFDAVGSEYSALAAYEQQYKHYPSCEGLYNVIQKSIELDEQNRVLKYIPALRSSDGYDEFEEKINASSIASVPLTQVAFVYDVDSYLNSVHIEALYNNGNKESAWTRFYQDINEKNNKRVYTNTIVPYINCLFNDKSLTQAQKVEYLDFFDPEFKVEINGIQHNILGWVEYRLEKIVDEYDNEQTIQGKIFNTYSQIKMNTCLYQIHTMLGDNDAANAYSDIVEDLMNEYNNLVLG